MSVQLLQLRDSSGAQNGSVLVRWCRKFQHRGLPDHFDTIVSLVLWHELLVLLQGTTPLTRVEHDFVARFIDRRDGEDIQC